MKNLGRSPDLLILQYQFTVAGAVQESHLLPYDVQLVNRLENANFQTPKFVLSVDKFRRKLKWVNPKILFLCPR